MKALKVYITITKNGTEGYVCSCDYPFEHFELGGNGSTVEEAKKDCFTFYDEMKREYPGENFPELDVTWVFWLFFMVLVLRLLAWKVPLAKVGFFVK